jgi:hypothetical protein
MRKFPNYPFLAAGCGACLAIVSLWLVSRRTGANPPKAIEFESAHILGSNLPAANNEFSPRPQEPYLRNLISRLREASTPETTIDLLRQAKERLKTMSPTAAVEEIRSFLASRQDAKTGFGFRIGPGGVLTESPTLRVWLLDYLASIDPAVAASDARFVLGSKLSADEWAVALRNLIKYGTPADQLIASQKVHELLTYEPWIDQPSAGFLESFDVAVYLGGTNQLSVLTSLISKIDNPAVAQAAYLALDRLTIKDATSTLRFMGSNLELLQGREETRANFFARADVREATQRELLERYLLAPDLTKAELTQFTGLYPNANFMISHNLLTGVATPDGNWLRGRDIAATRVVQEWEADPRFARLKPQLTIIKARLESFIDLESN